MRLITTCFVVSLIFVSCGNAPESITQTREQTQQEATNLVVEQTIMKNIVEEIKKEVKKEVVTAEVIEKTTPSMSKKRPILSFNRKIFDYGMIEQGEKVDYTFRFTNNGDADLIIKNATASCGCTTPSYPFMPIKPGETGKISVTFNSTGKMGTQRPNITVTSNSYPRIQTLYLEGFVTDQIAKKEKTTPLIEDGLDINPENNTAKGKEVKSEEVKEQKVELEEVEEQDIEDDNN